MIRALVLLLASSLVGACSSSPAMSGDASSGDPHAAARAACIAEINRLRATHGGLTPFATWTSAASCVDGQATSDEMSMMAHGAFRSGTTCGAHAQNECPGQGVSGIVGCLDLMWAEGQQPQCAGCDACAGAYTPNCPNCDYTGMATGHVCGHYVNMSSRWLTQAACGFSSLGGWDAIDFQ